MEKSKGQVFYEKYIENPSLPLPPGTTYLTYEDLPEERKEYWETLAIIADITLDDLKYMINNSMDAV